MCGIALYSLQYSGTIRGSTRIYYSYGTVATCTRTVPARRILFEIKYGTSTVQYSTVQYSTVQYSTVQYSTVQYSTVQYSTVQYITVQSRTRTISTSKKGA